jgi:hypothetical protein
MGLMPAGAGNPFTPVDKKSVVGTLKATGSRDPDVLHAQKQTLLAPYKHLKLLAQISFGVGALMTLTIFMAWFGIPVLLGAWWLWRFQARNSEAVEEGYTEYMQSAGG